MTFVAEPALTPLSSTLHLQDSLCPSMSSSPSPLSSSSSLSTPNPSDLSYLPDCEFPSPPKPLSKGPDHIPRPANAWMLFRAATSRKIKGIENNQRNVSKIISAAWRNMSEKDKAIWYERAATQKKLHAEKFPGYRYHPSARGSKPQKQKQKINGPRNSQRCYKLGTLLSQGTSLEELMRVAKKLDTCTVREEKMLEVKREHDVFFASGDCFAGVFDTEKPADGTSACADSFNSSFHLPISEDAAVVRSKHNLLFIPNTTTTSKQQHQERSYLALLQQSQDNSLPHLHEISLLQLPQSLDDCANSHLTYKSPCPAPVCDWTDIHTLELSQSGPMSTDVLRQHLYSATGYIKQDSAIDDSPSSLEGIDASLDSSHQTFIGLEEQAVGINYNTSIIGDVYENAAHFQAYLDELLKQSQMDR